MVLAAASRQQVLKTASLRDSNPHDVACSRFAAASLENRSASLRCGGRTLATALTRTPTMLLAAASRQQVLKTAPLRFAVVATSWGRNPEPKTRRHDAPSFLVPRKGLEPPRCCH